MFFKRMYSLVVNLLQNLIKFALHFVPFEFLNKIAKVEATSGPPSSEVSFDEEEFPISNPNPFLQPNILDIMFSEMSLEEVKSDREVCSTWDKVAVPLIGRQELEPVNFSKITFEDVITLKEELVKFPMKVKFFQGFEVMWEAVNIMIWTNFLESFKPNSIYIYRDDFPNPCPNLDHLLQPILTTLTNLTIEFVPVRSLTLLLNKLAGLQPLTLKSLEFYAYGYEEDPQKMITTFRALEGLFQSLSQTLEYLGFGIHYTVNEAFNFEGIQFQLPIFPRLQSLSMSMSITKGENIADYSVVAPFNFCEKFPKLVKLQLSDFNVYAMREILALNKGNSLKKLSIFWSNEDFEAFEDHFLSLYSSFPYIEEFSNDVDYLLFMIDAGVETWVNTLRKLELWSFPMNFNFGHFTKLEELHCDVSVVEDMQLHIASLIEIHSQLPQLKSFHITYRISSEQINEIKEGIPVQLGAILTIQIIPPYLLQDFN